MHQSLLQEALTRKLAATSLSQSHYFVNGRRSPEPDEDDELVNVLSMPGSPARSRATSRSTSPTRGAARRRAPGPLLLGPKPRSADPLKVFPTEVGQKIFSLLGIKQLANASEVSRKWNKSQTLNYVWFQLYRRENFHDDSLPPGKWTRRESKQNWRTFYLSTMAPASPNLSALSLISTGTSSSSRPSTPARGQRWTADGWKTPREIKEAEWARENDTHASPSKVEMREMYKELGGRKARKDKVGAKGRRDKGGWDGGGEDSW